MTMRPCDARPAGQPYSDGKVIRLSEDGTVIQWNADDACEYDSRETLAEFGGVENLFDVERKRLGLGRV